MRRSTQTAALLKVDTETVITPTSFGPGYLDKEKEHHCGPADRRALEAGLQPLRRHAHGALQPARHYGYEVWTPDRGGVFKYRKTHNDGVFDAYTPEMQGRPPRRASSPACPTPTAAAASSATTAGWPCTAWTALIEQKKADKIATGRLRDELRPPSGRAEELHEQIQRPGGHEGDGRRCTASTSPSPASNAREAVQWLYFGYLAAIKEQNGAAMSLGRVSTFLDIYSERDLQAGILHRGAGPGDLSTTLCMKLRMARHLRTPEYNELFGGDPMWVTESRGRHGRGRPATWSPRTAFRYAATPCTTSGPRRSPT